MVRNSLCACFCGGQATIILVLSFLCKPILTLTAFFLLRLLPAGREGGRRVAGGEVTGLIGCISLADSKCASSQLISSCFVVAIHSIDRIIARVAIFR